VKSLVITDAIIIAIIGLIGAVFTGGAAKLFDYRLNKIKHEFEKNAHIKSMEIEELKILKLELENRKEEIRKLEEDLDMWKNKYYEMLEHLIELRAKLKIGDTEEN
jgi:flagellar motor component MotA